MSFINELFNFINDVGEFLPGIESPYQHARRLRRATYYGALRRLEERKLIKKKDTPNGVAYSVTERGRSILQKPAVIKKRTDGFSTIVVFDIPEEKSKARKALRRFLIKNKFIPLQKSVYLSRNKVPGAIIELTKELDISSNVSVIGGKIEYFL